MAACQPLAAHNSGVVAQCNRSRAATPLRAVPPSREAQPVQQQGAALPPPPPAVGWLWDKKSKDTQKRLQEQNLRPKK